MFNNRKIEVPLDQILDVVYASDSYGYGDSVLLFSLADWVGRVSDEDIENYANSLVQGPDSEYTKEDSEAAVRMLTDWRNKYAKV